MNMNQNQMNQAQMNQNQNQNVMSAQAMNARQNMEAGSELAQSRGSISQLLLARATNGGFEFGNLGANNAGMNMGMQPSQSAQANMGGMNQGTQVNQGMQGMQGLQPTASAQVGNQAGFNERAQMGIQGNQGFSQMAKAQNNQLEVDQSAGQVNQILSRTSQQA